MAIDALSKIPATTQTREGPLHYHRIQRRVDTLFSNFVGIGLLRDYEKEMYAEALVPPHYGIVHPGEFNQIYGKIRQSCLKHLGITSLEDTQSVTCSLEDLEADLNAGYQKYVNLLRDEVISLTTRFNEDGVRINPSKQGFVHSTGFNEEYTYELLHSLAAYLDKRPLLVKELKPELEMYIAAIIDNTLDSRHCVDVKVVACAHLDELGFEATKAFNHTIAQMIEKASSILMDGKYASKWGQTILTLEQMERDGLVKITPKMQSLIEAKQAALNS